MAALIGLYANAPAAGKTTLALGLAGHGFLRLRFAGPLRAMLAALMREQGAAEDDITHALDGPGKEQACAWLGGRTPRHAMQTLGTEWGRRCMAPDLWLSAAERRLREALASGRSVVLDDVRFPDEAALVRRLGGLLVRVDRPGAPAPAWSHASEGGLGDIAPDMVLVNDACSPIAFVLRASVQLARAVAARRQAELDAP